MKLATFSSQCNWPQNATIFNVCSSTVNHGKHVFNNNNNNNTFYSLIVLQLSIKNDVSQRNKSIFKHPINVFLLIREQESSSHTVHMS